MDWGIEELGDSPDADAWQYSSSDEVQVDVRIGEEEEETLVYLFWNHGGYVSRSDVQRELGYSDWITRRVCETLEQTCLVETEDDETDGDIPDAKVYTITSDGMKYVRENDLETPTEVENREEIRDIRDVLVRLQQELEHKESRIEQLEAQNEYLREQTDALQHYVKQLIPIVEQEGYDIEPWAE